jgi:hypothetical protein
MNCDKCKTPNSCDGDGLCLEAYIAGRLAAERKRAADACARLAWMMEGGAGEVKPGERLRQAQKMILEGKPTPSYMTADMRRMP